MFSGLAAGAALTIKVTGIRSSKGNIRVALYNSPNGFPQNREVAFQRMVVEIEGDHATARFAEIPEGTYAVVLGQDENRNAKIDRNILGIPKEPWGMSNNPKFEMKPIGFDTAKFKVSAPETTITIELKH